MNKGVLKSSFVFAPWDMQVGPGSLVLGDVRRKRQAAKKQNA